MRLIDADALMTFCNNLRGKSIDSNDIARFPTVDAEPVRHGRWVKLDAHVGMVDHRCTACQLAIHVPTSWGEPLYEYCPVCGAKMDEGENDAKTVL